MELLGINKQMTIKRTRQQRRENSRQKRMIKMFRNLDSFTSKPENRVSLGQVMLAFTVLDAASRWINRANK